MTRQEIARSVRDLGELMERFSSMPDLDDRMRDMELMSLCNRAEARLVEMRAQLISGRPEATS